MKMIKRAAGIGLAIAFIASGTAFAQSLKDAQIAIDAEQYAKAKSILQTLIKNKPDEAENYFYLGDVYLTMDYPDSAQAIFEKGVAADEKDHLNQVGLGAVALTKGDAAGAEAKFTEATAKLKKKDYLPLLYAGRAYLNPNLEKPDYQKALSWLEKAKATGQKDALIYSSLGDAYFGLKDASNAYTNYRDAYDMDNTFTRARVQMTIISKQARAFEEAAQDLKAITQERADYAPAYRELAETYYLYAQFATKTEDYNSRLQEALGYYKKYMDLTDYSLDSRMRYADFLILAKDYKTLEVQAKEMAQEADVNPRILRYLGYASYQNGNYADAQKGITDFMGKVEESRIIPQDYFFLGLSEVKLATDSTKATPDTALLTEGVSNLTKAVTKDTTWSLAEDLSKEAKSNFDAKHFGLAGALFKAAAQAPKSKTYNYDLFYWGYSQYWNYVIAYQAKTNPSKSILEDAVTAFNKVHEVAPDMAEAYLFQARSERLMDDPENPTGLGVETFKKYISVVEAKGVESQTATTKRNLSEAYDVIAADLVNKEDYQGAREMLQKALAVNPNDDYAKTTLEQLAPAANTGAQPQKQQ